MLRGGIKAFIATAETSGQQDAAWGTQQWGKGEEGAAELWGSL